MVVIAAPREVVVEPAGQAHFEYALQRLGLASATETTGRKHANPKPNPTNTSNPQPLSPYPLHQPLLGFMVWGLSSEVASEHGIDLSIDPDDNHPEAERKRKLAKSKVSFLSHMTRVNFGAATN